MPGFSVETGRKEELVDITPHVAAALHETGVREGVCFVFVPHTTAGVTVNENADPSVKGDILAHLQKAVPDAAVYRHLEGNAPAHIKASLLGSSVMVPVAEGRLQLGAWQGILLAEFDGPRRRQVLVRCLGSA